jgi:hypothetical protein
VKSAGKTLQVKQALDLEKQTLDLENISCKCNMEVVMTDKIAAALAAILVFASAVTASAEPTVHANHMRAPAVRAYQSEPLQGDTPYCYLPSGPCDNEHTLTN